MGALAPGKIVCFSLFHLLLYASHFILRNITPAELLFGKFVPGGSKLFELFELVCLQND